MTWRSKLAKAITYAKNQRPYMENYLLDGRCSISNNSAERAVKSYVMDREKFLFQDTVKGARAKCHHIYTCRNSKGKWIKHSCLIGNSYDKDVGLQK